MRTISVILLIHGDRSLAGRALHRARALAGSRGEVIAVAATRVGCAALPRERITEPPVRVVATPGTRGLGEAFTEVRHDAVLVIHDDVLITSAGLEALVECSGSHPDSLILPRTNDPDTDTFVAPLPLSATARDRLHELEHETASEKPRVANRFRPACAYGPPRAFDQVFPLQPTFPGVVLDMAESRLIVAPGAVAAHDGSCGMQLADPDGPDGRPLLVANLIVRDEQDMLPDCLASLEGLVDRVEICDTGSTDETLRIARESGAHVIEREWRDDFAWARNEVLEESRDAWFVLQIDADERIVCDDRTLVRRRLATAIGEYRGFNVELRNTSGKTHATQVRRIFRADEVHFEFALHETVMSLPGQPPASWGHVGDIRIEHLGYDETVVARKEKKARNVTISRIAFERDPSPQNTLNYVRSLDSAGGDPQVVVGLLEDVLASDMRLPRSGHAWLLSSLARHVLAAGDAERALALSREALDLVPADDLAAAIHARAASTLGRDEEVLDAAAKRRESFSLQPAFTDTSLAADAMSREVAALARAGDADTAFQRAIDVLGTDAATFDVWRELAEVLLDRRPDDALGLLVTAALADGSGRCFRDLAAVLPRAATAELCVAYCEEGGTHAEAVRVGLLAALLHGCDDVVQRLVPYSDRLSPDVVGAIVRRARELGLRADLLEGALA